MTRRAYEDLGIPVEELEHVTHRGPVAAAERCATCGGALTRMWRDNFWCARCAREAVAAADAAGAVNALHSHPLRWAPAPAWQGVTRAQLRALVLDSLDACAQHELAVRAGEASGSCPACERAHAPAAHWRCDECARPVADGMRRCFPCSDAARKAS